MSIAYTRTLFCPEIFLQTAVQLHMLSSDMNPAVSDLEVYLVSFVPPRARAGPEAQLCPLDLPKTSVSSGKHGARSAVAQGRRAQ